MLELAKKQEGRHLRHVADLLSQACLAAFGNISKLAEDGCMRRSNVPMIGLCNYTRICFAALFTYRLMSRVQGVESNKGGVRSAEIGRLYKWQ